MDTPLIEKKIARKRRPTEQRRLLTPEEIRKNKKQEKH